MSEKNLRRLKRTVYTLIVLFIITFWTGFLQSTKFEFVIYIFYFILFVGGVKLIDMTFKSKATGMSKGFLLLTGFTLTIYFVFFVIAVLGNMLSGIGVTEILELLEGILYLDSLLFLIGVIGSIVLFKRNAEVNKIILLFLLLLGTESLSAQIYDYYSPYHHTKSSASQNIFEQQTTKRLSAKKYNYFSPYSYMKSNVGQNIFEKHRANFYPLYSLKDFSTSTDNNSQTSIMEEIGYILAMETVFTGMSYLASRKNGNGPAIAGGFDLFMGLAGIESATKQKSGIQTTGYFLLSAGFFAKSLYNFRFGKNHSTNTRFWTNFIGFNVLVFTGYFLDTLN